MRAKNKKQNTKKTSRKKTSIKNLGNNSSIFNKAFLNFSYSDKKSYCKIIRSSSYTSVVFVNLFPFYYNNEYLPNEFKKNAKFNLTIMGDVDGESLKYYKKNKCVGNYFFSNLENEKILHIECAYDLTNLNHLISSIEANGNEYLESLTFGTEGRKDKLIKGKGSELDNFSIIFQTEEDDPFEN